MKYSKVDNGHNSMKNKGRENRRFDGRWRNKHNDINDRMKGSDKSSGYQSPSIHGKRWEMWVAHMIYGHPSISVLG